MRKLHQHKIQRYNQTLPSSLHNRRTIYYVLKSKMNFEHSTHARSWLFDEDSLHHCREKVIRERMPEHAVDGGLSKVRKFASGFRQRYVAVPISHSDLSKSTSNDPFGRCVPTPTQPNLTSKEQAILVRFHAHQITMLIGPTAILPSLVRDGTVLATAITFFRRFYLSNSILDFKPRRMAVAAAFLAAKVEDQRVEVSLLSCWIAGSLRPVAG